MKTLAEYLKSAEDGTWLPEQTAFVLRHVHQVEVTYRQLLSGKMAPRQRSEAHRKGALVRWARKSEEERKSEMLKVRSARTWPHAKTTLTRSKTGAMTLRG